MSAPYTEWAHDEFLERCLERVVIRLRDVAAAAHAIAAAESGSKWMIEARVPAEQVEQLALLTSQGFRVIDTNVQLDCAPEALSAPVPSSHNWWVRSAQASDRALVREVAAQHLTTSRFHLDPKIGMHAGAQVKRNWVDNFFTGSRGDHMYVVDTPGGIRGFLLVLERDALGIIDLVALDPGVRGSGAAGALVHAWQGESPHLRRILVGTQVSNVRSLRAYAKLGFRQCSATYVLHRHPSGA
jgi:hypothetical protein